uniref:Uncharacterized protein n=1 Tax=Anguilla anguilla TaxID=7936 RepID=A0A0E9TAF6_ANGAN
MITLLLISSVSVFCAGTVCFLHYTMGLQTELKPD